MPPRHYQCRWRRGEKKREKKDKRQVPLGKKHPNKDEEEKKKEKKEIRGSRHLAGKKEKKKTKHKRQVAPLTKRKTPLCPFLWRKGGL